MGASSPVSQPMGECPCGQCGHVGTKLTRYGHLIGCRCRPCLGRRSKRKGRAAQARGYRALGGTAPFTPGHEESQGVLSVEVAAEAKAGAQIPRSLLKFARTVADRVVFMDGGRIVEAAPPAQFFSAPKTDRAKLFLSQVLGH